ncbi:hypothetical protein ACHAW5_009542 [Stephanodiscus triporus]|uniref:Uncharacterized protein n=1 Tax=Stephanodiscus triporus TaxID=2934178 RepID=A0ABD3NDN7_9STRA
MANYGYNLEPDAIVKTGTCIRAEAGPATGSAMSHTAVRLLAICWVMERKMVEKKLHECAKNWATEVSSLTGPVKKSAENWAKKVAVQDSVVESIYYAWDGERHTMPRGTCTQRPLDAAADKGGSPRRNHRCSHCKANPLLMVFTLAPYFDFCISWEDDASGWTEFFKELGNVNGNADLQWIYRAAYDKYREIAETKRKMRMSLADAAEGPMSEVSSGNDDNGGVDPIWIHVGDDLAYDVGGSASCGARTILDLDNEYGQTAKARFSPDACMPSWSTAPMEEIIHRRLMNDGEYGK